jgi:hypothetical protein
VVVPSIPTLGVLTGPHQGLLFSTRACALVGVGFGERVVVTKSPTFGFRVSKGPLLGFRVKGFGQHP